VNRPGVVVLGLGLVTAAVSAGRVWVRFTVQDPVLGLQSQGASGYAAAPALSACGLMALAALLVLLLTRRWARATGLVVLSASAVAAAWLVGGVLRDPLGAARASLAGHPSAIRPSTTGVDQSSTGVNPAGDAEGAPIRSLSSRAIRAAPLRPMPGGLDSVTRSSDATAVRN